MRGAGGERQAACGDAEREAAEVRPRNGKGCGGYGALPIPRTDGRMASVGGRAAGGGRKRGRGTSLPAAAGSCAAFTRFGA